MIEKDGEKEENLCDEYDMIYVYICVFVCVCYGVPRLMVTVVNKWTRLHESGTKLFAYNIVLIPMKRYESNYSLSCYE